MSRADAERIQAKGTSRHFLLSRTDTRALDEKIAPEFPGISSAITARFPEMKTDAAFIDAAVAHLHAAPAFAALAVRLDLPPGDEGAAGPEGVVDAYATLADVIAAACPPPDWIWGMIRTDALAACCRLADAPRLREKAAEIQQAVRGRLDQSVTIGIAEYPCDTFTPADVCVGTMKALDHAAFFGPGSVVVFDAVSLNISGDHHYDRGEIEAAIAEFERAIRLDAGNVNVYNSLGVCFGIRGDYPRAAEAFKAAIDLDAREYMAVYNLGLVHLLQGERRMALEQFQRADGINPRVFEILFQTGKLLLEDGDPAAGIDCLKRAAGIEKNSGQVFRYLGEGYSATGDPKAAIRAYKKAVRANPSDAASLSALGCLFDERGENPEIALVFCEESVALAPENALFRHRLGALYLKQGRLAEALKQFRKAELLGFDASEDIQSTEARMAASR